MEPNEILSIKPLKATLPVLPDNLRAPLLRSRVSWLQIAIVLIAGCAHAVSLAWPFSLGSSLGLQQGQPLWWLQLLALALLVGQLNAVIEAPVNGVNGVKSWKRAAWLGGLFATAMLCTTFWWLFVSMHIYGGLAAPLTVLAIVLLAALLGLYYAAASSLFVQLAPASLVGRAVLFAALWLMAELTRVQLFTGFPWGEGGYAHVDGWAKPLAALIGVHGLSFAAALVSAGLALAVRKQNMRWLTSLVVVLVIAGCSLIAALLPVPEWSDNDAGLNPLTVTLLQGNIPQDEKFESGTGVLTALSWYGDQLQNAKTALVVAPETAIPLLPQQLPGNYWQALALRFSTGQQAALIGLPLGDFSTGYANAVVGLKPASLANPAAQQPAYRYDKHHLVPFGEFIPLGFRWFTEMMNIPLGDFNRGAVVQPTFDWMNQRLAPNICYEDLFGEELGARFINPALAPTVFVNVSNIGWFGNTVAIDQHLHISRMRSLEFNRPMIRATNTGATVIIDHRGQVTHSLERHTRGVLVGEVTGQNSMTPYAWWVSRYGLWPLWIMSLGVVALALAQVLRRR